MHKTVTITNGTYNGRTINGDFPYVGVKRRTRFPAGQVRVQLLENGIEIGVMVGENDFLVQGQLQAAIAQLSDDELAQRIHERFEVMNQITDSVLCGETRSTIISGAPGVGKSYDLEGKIEHIKRTQPNRRVRSISGKITPIALYMELFECRDADSVLILDDIDSVFSSEESLNLLKAALDTSDVRTISWLSGGSYLEDQGIDDEFNFEGSVIFITNMNFDEIIEKGGNMAQHFKALISRSVYLDLCVHTSKEIMIRIEQIVGSTNIMQNQELSAVQGEELMGWVRANYENMRELSLRTIVKLAGFMRSGSNWQTMARVTQLKGRAL